MPAQAADSEQRARTGQRVVNLGLLWNIVLAVGKTTVMGILGHSTALLSDGINSTSDVAYYIVVKIFMKLAGQPPDPEHPYGHQQMESIAALTVGSFVITTAIAIFWTAVNNVFDLLKGRGDVNEATLGALWVALFTVAVKIVLTVYTRTVGEKTGNLAIKALAFDHRNDVFSALAASLGIFLARRGHPWVDPLAGALVALLILRTGIGILRQSTDDLMDSVPSDFLDRRIRGHPGKHPRHPQHRGDPRPPLRPLFRDQPDHRHRRQPGRAQRRRHRHPGRAAAGRAHRNGAPGLRPLPPGLRLAATPRAL